MFAELSKTSDNCITETETSRLNSSLAQLVRASDC